ncbi:MAG TPA: hypothetical protein VGV89_00385 [Thermoplasmata archaeon]|nr:hypothetical protein [Thermoplasmata archaeon]
MTARAKPIADSENLTNRAHRTTLRGLSLLGGSEGSGVVSGGLRRSRFGAARTIGLAVAFGTFMVLSTFAMIPLAGASSGATGGSAAHAEKAIPPARSAPSTASPRYVPGPYLGQSPSSAPLTNEIATAYPSNLPTPTAAQFLAFANHGGFDGQPLNPSTSPSSSGSATRAPAAPTTAATSGTATATGTVEDSLTHATISGVLVAPSPIGGDCTNQSCPPTYTSSTGTFTVSLLLGADQITFSAGYYVTNYTVVVNVTAGHNYPLGIIYMVPDAIVCGTVEGNDSLHETIAGVQVSGESRDTRLTATPTAITGGNGQFTVPVPPGASELILQPVQKWGLYFGTTYFVDLPAGAGVKSCVNIGIILLPVGVVVTASLYNRETRTAVPVNYGAYWAMQACARDSAGVCFPQGHVGYEGGSAVTVSPIGPITLEVMADGYITNTSTFFVPSKPPGTTVNLGKVFLLPQIPGRAWTNLTWQSTVTAGVAEWGTGNIVGSTCSLDGYQFAAHTITPQGINMTTSTCAAFGCVPINTEYGVALAPLRNSFHVYPDTGRSCNPFGPTWPIPGELPVSDNWTWINATEGHLFNIHGVNVTPGSYVEGRVLPNNLYWTATACSTDASTVCFGASGNQTITPIRGCPTAAYSSYPASELFCAAVPPGPYTLKIESASGNAPANFTEAYNPPGVWNTLPMNLCQASSVHICDINLTVADVVGKIHDALTGGVIPNTIVTVEIEPAGLQNSPTAEALASLINGSFIAQVSEGWDTVLVRAPNFEANSTTLYVHPGRNNAGIINLTPQSYITGQILSSTGYPMNTSSVDICAVAGNSCNPITIGGGLVSTNGTYFYLVQAGHLPIGAYEVVANAPGYLGNWSWVNVTQPGTVVTAPTIELYPILGSSARPHALAYRAPSAAWIYGRISDNTTNQGLPDATINIQPLGGGAPSSISGQFTQDGVFNFSQSLGSYWMNFSDPGYYYPASYFVTVNGTTPSIDIGTVRLVPLPVLHGQIVINPWSANVSYSQGVGPAATVRVCVANLTFCGASGPTDSGGFFNITAPLGKYDRISVTGTATGTGTAAGGYLTNSSKWNVTNEPTTSGAPTFVMGVTVFAAYTGVVMDASDHNRSPVRWGTVGLQAVTPTLGAVSAGEALTGGGGYVVFLPPGNITNDLVQGSAWVPVKENLTNTYDYNETIAKLPSQLNVLPLASLEHFGWIQFNVTASVLPYGANTLRVPYATAAANVWTKNATEISSLPTTSDGWGYVNMSAPPGANVTIAVSAPDFNITGEMNISVNQSETSIINGTQNHFGKIGNVSIIPWGWVRGVVWDPANNSGVPIPAITTTDNASISGAPGLIGNYVGAYLSDMALNNPVQLSVTRSGYETNNSEVQATPGKVLNETVNLTGEGIVAGRVLGYPGLGALYQAYVSVCPVAFPQCSSSNATTNGSGYFWVIARPGADVINVSIPDFAVNGSLENIVVHSDTWQWAGTFVLSQYATITGTVLGDPSGDPLDNANVSVCSVLALPGQPTGPCFETVKTDVIGYFTLSVPAGNYILAINDSYYNTSYLPISLTAGEVVSLGTIQLAEYGAIQGTVLGSDTDAPIAGTLVRACPTWSAGNCTVLEAASGAGRYYLFGPPGAYVLTASAPGYQDGYITTAMLSGQVTDVPTVFLTPVGTDQLFSISGVVTGGTDLLPLAGAVVSAGTNYATATNAAGVYNLVVPWGTYYVAAAANGYTSEGRFVVVHANVTSEDFVLPQALYTVSGTTRDGLTGDLVPNVEFYTQGSLVATSDKFGTYSIALGNGSYTFTTEATGVFQSIYAPVTFSVEVQGTSTVRNLQMFPVTAQVYGVVVNSLTGAPIANATVVIAGSTQDSYPETNTYTTGALGTFVAPVYIGSYGFNVSAGGYIGQSSAHKFSTNATVPITISLTPLSTTASGGGGGFGLGPILLIVGVAAAGVIAFVGLGRLRASSPSTGQQAASGRSR